MSRGHWVEFETTPMHPDEYHADSAERSQRKAEELAAELIAKRSHEAGMGPYRERHNRQAEMARRRDADLTNLMDEIADCPGCGGSGFVRRGKLLKPRERCYECKWERDRVSREAPDRYVQEDSLALKLRGNWIRRRWP